MKLSFLTSAVMATFPAVFLGINNGFTLFWLVMMAVTGWKAVTR